MSTKRKRPVKDVKFNMRFDRKLKADAERAAAEDSRTLAGLIEKLLRDYLAQKPKRRP
jgi:predicted HicB family RNase H-like nuclease